MNLFSWKEYLKPGDAGAGFTVDSRRLFTIKIWVKDRLHLRPRLHQTYFPFLDIDAYFTLIEDEEEIAMLVLNDLNT